MSSIKMFGNCVPIDSEVVLWSDKGGFNGYTTKPFVQVDRKTGKEVTKKGPRFGKPRKANQVTQIVVHHSGGDGKDPSGMYQTLWFNRFLSVQFSIEDSGKIYQYLDAQETAWHAGAANGRSIGIECALFPLVKSDPHYYDPAMCEKRKNLPHEKKIQVLQGQPMEVYQMPEPQVQALADLCASLWLGLGRTELPKFPRTELAEIPYYVIPVAQAKSHVGLITHAQLTKTKYDPAGIDLENLENLCAKAFCKYFPG